MSMQIVALIMILGFLTVHLIISSLAFMQAHRLKHVTRTNKYVTWGYTLISTGIAIGAIVTLFTIKF